MPGKIIKNHHVTHDNYEIVKAEAYNADSINRHCIVPLPLWNQWIESGSLKNSPAGLWLDSHEAPEDIAANIDQAQVIAINFPVFTDGRGYSLARLLRERYQFKGELRAIGDIHRDQLFFLSRCGFDSFSLVNTKTQETAIESLSDFSVAYQNAVDTQTPVIR